MIGGLLIFLPRIFDNSHHIQYIGYKFPGILFQEVHYVLYKMRKKY